MARLARGFGFRKQTAARSAKPYSDQGPNRPRHSQLGGFAQLGLEPGATRGQLSAAIAAIPEAERRPRLRELFGTTRAFFGSALRLPES
jgi:hypothetical protein